jgi:hypothetical protein
LLTVVFALLAMLAPAGVAAADTVADDAPAHELVFSVRTAVAPVAPRADAAAADDDRPIGLAPTDDDLVHPDLEPHDGPPLLRGPPAS